MALTLDQTKRVEYIQQKFKTFDLTVTKLERYLEGPHPNSINAKLRLDSLAQIYKDYLKYNDELS